uniref:Glutaredoxin domain-containing protein n=1 Tax=Panagrellus redivivus TaxID=6233 RepID=A0A7E4VGM5_PANRE
MPLTRIANKAEFDAYSKQPGVNIIHFAASWASACGQLNEIFVVLIRELKNSFNVGVVEAEEVPEASLQCGITAAPTVVFFKNGVEVDKIHGFHPTEVKNLIVKHTFPQNLKTPKQEEPQTQEDLNDRLKRLINHSRVTLFMKGNAQAPRCGFSRQMIDLLNSLNVDYWTFDILEDNAVREGLKVYSDWPTYPQLYLDGELLGGLDVIREEIKNPAFVENLPKRV